ncbi:hypothetical protein [Bacillus sp. Brlt_9]|uniref:hypothetical protein n=1 Tax=Bacillus sp. Brlt_9 TaxID=3110916 RepID=UPI003F7C7C0B
MTIKFEETTWVSKYNNNILMTCYRRSEDLGSWETFYFNVETERYVNFYARNDKQWNYKPLSEEEIAYLLEYVKKCPIEDMDIFSFEDVVGNKWFEDRMQAVLKITDKDFNPAVLN